MKKQSGPTIIKLEDLKVGQKVAFDCDIGTVESIQTDPVYSDNKWVEIRCGCIRTSTSQKDFVPESTIVTAGVDCFKQFNNRLWTTEGVTNILNWPDISRYMRSQFEDFCRAHNTKARKKILKRVETFVEKIETFMKQRQGLIVDGVKVTR